MATTGAALAAGVVDWTIPRDRAIAAPGPKAEPTGTQVPVRTDLAAVAPTVDGIKLDGQLSDSRWGDPHWQSFTTLYALDEVPDTGLYAVHDATTLYVGVRLTGEQAATVTHASFLVRRADGGDEPFRTTTVELRKVTPTTRFASWGGDTEELTDPVAAFAVADGSASCAVAVPLSELGITGDPAGAVVSLNVVVDHEDQTRPVTTVAPTRTSDTTYNGGGSASMYTDVVGEDRAALVHLGRVAPVAAGREPAELSAPEQITLDYVDFTHKALTVALPGGAVADQHSVDWRGPGQDWTTVASELRPGRGGAFATFEHPAPTSYGQYHLRIRVRARSGADRVVLASFDRHDLIRAGDQLPGNRPHQPRGDDTVTPAPASPEVEQLLALVPERTGFRFCGLPEEPSLHPDKVFTWSADEPDRLTAKSTGTVYPNDQFPEDKEFTVTNRLGDPVSYPYHQDAEGKRYFISAHLWYQQREYVYDKLIGLAESDPLGAARVLHRLGTVYQGWVATNEYPWWNRPVEPSATPRNFWWGGVWQRWSTSQLGVLADVGTALEIVERTDALDVLSDEVGEDVRGLLINDTINDSVEWLHTFTRRYHNNDYASYVALGVLSKVLGDSRFVHEAVEYTGEYVRRGFLFDGFWKETTLSYHLQSLNGLFKIANAAKGWSDAEGYQSPRSGRRITDLDLLEDMSVLAGSARIGNLVVYPDGKLFPMADTWASSKAADPDFDTGSFHLGASNVTRMSRGPVPATEPPENANPSQAYLLATPKYGHNQWDPLSLAVWAEGQELLPDLGYTHTKYRRWACSTIGHNTVVVDSADMESDGADGGSLELFSHADPTVQVVRASFGTAYPQTEEYRRETWSIENPGTDRHTGYLLDLFRVTGGARHEFTLNGDANRDAEMTTTATLTDHGPYLLPPGVEVTEPETELDYGDAEGHYYGYIYVRDVQRGDLPDGNWDLDLSTTLDDGSPGSGAHLLGLAGEGTELFLGQSPSLRATRLHGTSQDTNDVVDKWWLPKVVLRRDGSNLRSQFVTMIEPHAADGSPSVQSIRHLEHDGTEDDLAIEITHTDGTVDVVISAGTGDGTITAGGVSLTGRLGFARLQDGNATRLHLVGGTALTAPGAELTGAGAVTGTVTGTRRTFTGDEVDALVTDAQVPEWVAGHTVVVTHPDGKTHAYPVKSVTSADGATSIVLDRVDPGFVIDPEGRSHLEFTPYTTWQGETTFRIENTQSSQ